MEKIEKKDEKKSDKDKKEKKPFGRPGNTLKMGIVGLPNIGKSSTFNLLSKLQGLYFYQAILFLLGLVCAKFQHKAPECSLPLNMKDFLLNAAIYLNKGWGQ